MTDYGRSPGSEPWYPEDPLYGDQGWQTQQGPGGVPAPQGGQAQQHDPTQYHQGHYGTGQVYPQQYAQQQAYGGDPYGTGQHPVYDPAYGQNPQAPGGHLYAGDQGQAQGPVPQGPYPGQQPFPGQRRPGQEQPYPSQQHPGAHEQYAGNWGNGSQPGHPGQPGDYGGRPEDPYAFPQEQFPQEQFLQDPYAQGRPPQDPPDYYGGQDGYGQQAPQPSQYAPEDTAPDEHRGQQGAVPEGTGHGGHPGSEQPPGPDETAARTPGSEWDDSIPEETHPFFTGGGGPAGSDDGDGGDHGDDGQRDDRDDRDSGPRKKGRSTAACLVVAVVLVATVGGVGYVGYHFYESRFGPPPDFAGGGTGSVQVDVPDGANGSDIASLLFKKGVVKSEGAFVAAQDKNPKGTTIQAGLYTLKTHMSAQSAVTLMLDPHSRNALIIPEGTRDAAVYQRIDKQLGLKAGTTHDVAMADYKSLGLPSWADDAKHIKDPLEGFLFPASYPAAKGTKPETVLKEMVARANQEYTKYDLAGNAKKLKLSNPWQLLTVASLVQAEGKTHDDFQKMAEVVYNRLDPANTETGGKLQFDSTFNYLKGQSNIDISQSEINNNFDPYNTYTQQGLPPGPIDNPGEDALSAAINPTHDGWMYFVATDGANQTQFAKTYAQFQQLKDKFNAHQQALGG